MKEKDFIPFGYTIFCDDIRHELGHKLSLIGVYSDALLVEHATFPLIIPKLAMSIGLTFRASELPTDIEIRVYFPDDEETPVHTAKLNTSELSDQQDQTMQDLAVDVPDDDKVARFRFQLIVSPAEIKTQGFIKVRAIVDDELMKLGSLRIGETTAVQA